MVYTSPGSGLTKVDKYKFGARVGKYNFGARAGGWGQGRRSEPGSWAKQRAGGRQIQIPVL